MIDKKYRYIGIQGCAIDSNEAIRLCGAALAAQGYVDQSFAESCIEREHDYPTGLPGVVPVAIPHCQSSGIIVSSVCILKLDEPVKFYRMDSSDEYIETTLVFNLAIKGSDDHLEYLQKLMAFVMDEEKMRACASAPMEEVLQSVILNLQ